ncbi:HlyC/CorC family transporter [Suttonella sp. R2A3]|uniref:HlyC/CorC family transporter n=1 Tax=Suttonella sp. R2A3 TaxID=2908648 RepID=UPI001F3F2A57|nr:HlyC/CorC family transporter [Suttonella sp. R2A3]UJF24355.1 HlyC/CorC family transporter [Suttonella sp. R2A3]
MDHVPIGILVFFLIICLLISAFFSSSETAMMSLNRYKTKHLAEEGHRGAQRALHLLKRPDRLLGTILLGNNFVNIVATSLATIIGIRLLGDVGVLLATIILTIVVLIFSEVAPKTLAAISPQRIAFPASWVLRFLVKLLYPLVAMINILVLLILRPFGVRSVTGGDELITNEELKTIVLSSSTQSISPERQDMLMGVLELEDISVDEAMVPRNELEGVDLNDPWDEIIKQITNSRHGRLVAYRDNLDRMEGMLHLRDIIWLFHEKRLDKPSLMQALRPCLYVPEGTPLRAQLFHFQQHRARSALVVDEYGDIQGLITLEDILTHIVGDLVSDHDDESPEIVHHRDQIYHVEGSMSLRQINRELGLKLPLDGPNTLSGLIIETLGNFPEAGTEVQFNGCTVQVIDFIDGVVGQAEVHVVDDLGDREV